MNQDIITAHEIIPTAPLLPSLNPFITYVEPLLISSRKSEELKLLIERKGILEELADREKINRPFISLGNKYVIPLLKEKEIFNNIDSIQYYIDVRESIKKQVFIKHIYDGYRFGYLGICDEIKYPRLGSTINASHSYPTYNATPTDNFIGSCQRSINTERAVFIGNIEKYEDIKSLLGKWESWKGLTGTQLKEKNLEHKQFIDYLFKIHSMLEQKIKP